MSQIEHKSRGRPRILKRPVTRLIYLDADEYAIIRDFARANGMSINELIRRAIRVFMYISQQQPNVIININNLSINAPLINNETRIKIDVADMADAIETINTLKSIINNALNDKNVTMRLDTARKLARKLTRLVKANDSTSSSLLVNLVKLISDGKLESWAKARDLINELESYLPGEN